MHVIQKTIQKLMSYDLFICFMSYKSNISTQPITMSYNSKMQNKFFYPQLMMKSKTISEEEDKLTKRRRKRKKNDVVYILLNPEINVI